MTDTWCSIHESYHCDCYRPPEKNPIEPKCTHSFAIITNGINPLRRIDVHRLDNEDTQIQMRTWHDGLDEKPLLTVFTVTPTCLKMLFAALNEDINKWKVKE